MNRNSSGFKALFTFRNLILDVKSTFLMHSNSLNVSPVSLFDSFDALKAFVLFKQSNPSQDFAILKRIVIG